MLPGVGMRSLFATLALAGAVALSACGAEQVATSAEPPAVNVGHGISLRLPQGWQVAGMSLTPHLVDPLEVMSVGTFPMHYREAPCSQFPVSALEDLGPADAFVTLQERGLDPRSAWLDFPPRPVRFGPGLGGPTDVRGCLSNAGLTDHWFGFADGGRHLNALVVFGSQATPEVRAQAWEILDSLRVDPRVRPDWQASP